MPVARAAALVLCLLAATLANATTQRTFVASTGVDTNTAFHCSIAQPCRGFAAAIGITSAKGEVIVLDSAGYGAIPSITKSITINAPTGIYAGISVFSGDGITINAGITDTVVLRGLTINGQGGANGITINNALTVHVENCVIANMGDKGIYQVAGTLDVKDTIVRDGVWGIFVQAPGQANLDHVRIEGNATGVAAEYGGPDRNAGQSRDEEQQYRGGGHQSHNFWRAGDDLPLPDLVQQLRPLRRCKLRDKFAMG